MPKTVKELQRDAEQLMQAIRCDCKIMGLEMELLDGDLIVFEPRQDIILGQIDPAEWKYTPLGLRY